MTAWLSEAAELDAYEGILGGDERCFRAFAEPLQPTLQRLASLYVDSEATGHAVVVRTWEQALRGLDQFRWHTPLATWIAKITVAFGRPHAVTAEAPSAPPIASRPTQDVAGSPDWSDLPWGARWEDAGTTLAWTLAAMPVDQREVIHGHDVELWPPQRVCEVFGLPEATYERALAEAHMQLHDALASLVGYAGASEHRSAQIVAISGWLNTRLDDRHEHLDARTMTFFRWWWATRQTAWRRLTHPLRSVAG